MYKNRGRKGLVFDKIAKNFEKKVKKIGTYLTYIGAQKRAVARFCAPLALYKPRGTYLIPTCPHHNSKDTLISSAERSGAGKFWILAPLRCEENELQCENSNVFGFEFGLKHFPESDSAQKIMLF